MNTDVIIKTYAPPPVDRREIMRYAGGGYGDPQLEAVLDGCLAELSEKLTYRVSARMFHITRDGGKLDLGFAVTESKALAKNLEGCGAVLLFAATVGFQIDRMIARYSTVSPVRSLFFQAIGAERIEALCDEFCRDMEREYGELRPRFSPGYGDLDIGLQRDIFAVLDCPRSIGVTLNESMLMSPTKSVSAIVGIKSDNI